MPSTQAKKMPNALCSVANCTVICSNSQDLTPHMKVHSCSFCHKRYCGTHRRTELLVQPKREGEYIFPIYSCRGCLGNPWKGSCYKISSSARDIWNLAMQEDEAKIAEIYSSGKY
mmetsp:Transcript_11829/g.20567  ORF Transcript_11829/g.20567 Transcript_11829/m.20567 type:complete len:115 (-) Transcript_11829:226-570(-)